MFVATLANEDETPATPTPSPTPSEEPTATPTPSPSVSPDVPSTCGTVDTPCYVHVPDGAPEFLLSSVVLVVMLLSAILAAQLRRP